MIPYTRMLTGAVPEIADFVARRQGSNGNWGNYNTLSFYDSKGLKVALIYNEYHWPNIAVHVAARPGALWCHPDILYHIFAYPFLELKCTRVTSPVLANNERCVAVCKALGYQLEGCLREASPSGQSILLFGMLRSECRWIRRLDGQRSKRCA